MKLYKFDEFVNEMVYCKLKNARWYYFGKIINKYVEELTDFYKVLNRNDVNKYDYSDVRDFSKMYREKFKKEFDLLELYGMKYELVQSDKGDKFVFSFDDKHSIHFYPMCDETKPQNASNYNDTTKLVTNPRYDMLVVYAVDNGKATKIDTTLNNFYLADTCTYRNAEYLKLYKILDEYVDKWKIKNDIDKKNEEIDVLIGEMKVFMKEKIERDRKEYEEQKEQERLKKEEAERLDKERREQRGDGVDVLVTYKGNTILSNNYAGSYVRPLSMDNIKYLLATYFRCNIEDALSKDEHPDVSDMTNLDDTSKQKPVYTPRNLPKDHYELVEYYRTYAYEMCEHCGKFPIVNIMVIKNPKGEIFHVGNECVSHLVDIPEEEFEKEWNVPFKLASGIMNKVRSDKNKNFEKRWYVYGDMCYYLSSANPLLDCPFFDTSYFTEKSFYTPKPYKLMKRDFSLKEVRVPFMKRMLPRYYENAVMIDFNIKDMYDMMLNADYVKYGYGSFNYDGIDYRIPERLSHGRRIGNGVVEGEDYEQGLYSQKYTDLGMGDYNMEYKFGDVTISYKWKSIPVK